MSNVRVIKRYANRKLYDTERSRYVTLDELAGLVRAGEDLRIIDNQTKEDLTSVTLAQILLEEEKRAHRNRPLDAMRQLIGQSGELFQRRIGEPVNQWRSSVEESVNRLLKSGEERAAETRASLQAWFDQNTQALEELQARLDERLKGVLGNVALLTHLQREMTTLRERLDRVEAHLGIPPAATDAPSPPPDDDRPAPSAAPPRQGRARVRNRGRG
jgi:polyhydroxyalkanoate synthesis repressor PhaR